MIITNMGTTIHISEAEAAEDFPGLMAKVRAGAEVIIESGHSPAVVLKSVGEPRVRLLSESLRMARVRNSIVTLDGDFGSDLEAVVAAHSAPIHDPWA
jgi:hypothetical protein